MNTRTVCGLYVGIHTAVHDEHQWDTEYGAPVIQGSVFSNKRCTNFITHEVWDLGTGQALHTREELNNLSTDACAEFCQWLRDNNL